MERRAHESLNKKSLYQLLFPSPFSLLLSLVFFYPPFVLMLFSLVRVISREGEQIRLFTHQDVYMFTHTHMYTPVKHRREASVD